MRVKTNVFVGQENLPEATLSRPDGLPLAKIRLDRGDPTLTLRLEVRHPLDRKRSAQWLRALAAEASRLADEIEALS